MENKLFELLKSVNEEKAIIEKKPDGNYHVVYKKRLLNNDGSDEGWLYIDVPNVRLNDDNVYIVEPIKEDSQWSKNWRKWWHESCDELGLPYDTSFKDFTLALGKYLYPNGTSYPPNRAERRKLKRKKR